MLSKRRAFLKEDLRQKALKLFSWAAAELYAAGAEAVYLFGSVLKPGAFDERSDVDIAVKGIPMGRRPAAERRVDEIFLDVSFDLIFFEDAVRPEIRERILKEGVLWWAMQGLNLRPLPCEGSALPLS